MKRFVFFFLAVCLMMGATAGAASAKTLYVYAESETSNSSVVEASAVAIGSNFKVTTYDNQCVELRFSAEALTFGSFVSRQIQFWPVVDGQPAYPTAGGFGLVYWDAPEYNAWDFASFTWFACGLNRGAHNVTIYYNPYTSGNTAYLRATVLAIELKSGKLLP